MTRIVALGHQSRVGKDTAARIIERVVAEQGYSVRRFAFATPLKALAHELFGHAGMRMGAYYETEEGAAARDVPLCGGCPAPPPGKPTPPCSGLVHLTPVQVWIALGQKMRDIYPAVWADAGMRAIREWGGAVAIVTDLRFTNEGRAVQAAGGWCVKVVRPDAPPPKGSDDMIDRQFPWNATLVNDGDLGLLELRAAALARAVLSLRGAE